MKREDKQQFTFRIAQANSTQLVVILYEMLLCYLEDAVQALAGGEMAGEGKQDEFREAVRKARRLARGEQCRDGQILEEIRKVIEPLCQAYTKLAEQNSAGPVMKNSQTVYAGLTYGRNTLTENMADQGANRGMLV